MNRWRIFNILSVIAGMVAASLWLGLILAYIQAPSWATFIIGVLLGRVTMRIIRDMIA